MRKCLLVLACAALSLVGAPTNTFVGTIGDDMCSGDHKAMDGKDPVQCTNECVQKMKAKYALWVGKKVYVLSDQSASAPYAGKKVKVVGSVSTAMDGKEKVSTLTVKSIAPAN